MRGAWRHLLILAVALTLSLAWVRNSAAQACCTSTGSSALATAAPGQVGVVSVETSYERGLGSFDANGRYQRLTNANVDDVVLALGGALRLGASAWQIVGTLPLRLQHREFHGLPEQTALAPGDARLDVRWSLLEDEAQRLTWDARTWLPSMTPFVGVLAPTGTAPEATTRITGVDITGDGSWTLLAGSEWVKALGLADTLDLEASYGYRVAHSVVSRPGVRGRTFAPGDEVDLRVGFFHRFDLSWTAGVLLSGRWTLAVAGVGADSATRRVRAGLLLAKYLNFPTWQLRLTLLADPPLDELSKNVPFSGPTLTLGLLRSFPR